MTTQSMHVTKTVFRVSDFLAWQRHKSLDLRPPFQRGSVWNPRSKSMFMDSIIKGFPIPLIFLKDETDPITFEPHRLVVDGQQRLRTLIAFIDRSVLNKQEPGDDFTISRSHNRDSTIYGTPFQDLSGEVRSRILDFELSVHILPPSTPDRVLLDMFARLNSTGTRLNEQEIRNAEWAGEFKTAAYDLAYKYLEEWISWQIFTRPQVARMKEVELVSELLILCETGLRGKSQPAIDATYRQFDETWPNANKVISRATTTMDEIVAIGSLLPGGLSGTPFNSQSWFYALFAMIHGALYPSPIKRGPDKPHSIKRGAFRDLLVKRAATIDARQLSEDLVKALRGAATDRSSREIRLDFLLHG